jgi:dTDP-glucose pyrophosphorylase
VRDTITTIGSSGRQIALVLDDADHLLGVVTDGDVRRGILRGVDLEDSVSAIMNADPLVAHPGDDRGSIIERMERLGIRRVPLVDADGRVTGLFTAEKLLLPETTSTPVVLMAGGRGQRLYPLTKDVPKPMLPVGGVPLVEIILRNLAAQGFVDVFVSVNYLADVITEHVGDGSAFGLRVEYVREDKPLGTAGALAALDGRITEPFLVMNSDLLTQVNLRHLLSFHAKQGVVATVGVREHVFEIPYGVVNLDGTSVESMVEKPMHRSLVNAGIYAMDPAALGRLTPGEYADMPTLLGTLMAEGRSVAAFPIHESWLDVGRPEDLELARTQPESWITP